MRFIVLLRVSFKVLASCFVLLVIASESIYFGTYLICLSFKLPPDRCDYINSFFLAVRVSCGFELLVSGRQFSTFSYCTGNLLLTESIGI